MSDAARFVFYLLAALSFFAAVVSVRLPQVTALSREGLIALGLLMWVLVPLISTEKLL